MNRRAKRSWSVTVATVCAGVALVVGSAGSSAHAATWVLEDYQQKACVALGNPYVPKPTTYYGIYIDGGWRRAINAGATDLPADSTAWGVYTPIRRGSSDGEYSLAYVEVQVNQDTPLGTYTLDLWASDGSSTQSVPVTLTVATKCGNY